MMDSRGNEVENPGNIELKTVEETEIDSENSSIFNEESGENRLQVQKKTGCQCFPTKTNIWKILKSIVFLICLILVVVQSIEFYKIYSKYPTNIVEKSAVFNEVKLPAVTICFKNTVSTTEFCLDNPDWCERPNNLEEFCMNHPIHCKGDTSNLMIPMTGYYTNNSRKFQEITENYLDNEKFNDPYLYKKNGSFSETRTFVKSGDYIYKCYSRNLHLYQSVSKLDTQEVDFNTDFIFGFLQLELYRIELFGLPGEPQVFLGIHSPFVSFNPVLDGHVIRSGYTYKIEVQMEKEEHLLPPPYQTNCRDNEPSEDAKNFKSPNSFQMCLEMCESEWRKGSFGCDIGMIMASLPINFCDEHLFQSIFNNIELSRKLTSCLQNCRPGCLKLHYNYKIEEFKHPVKQDEGIADIQMSFRNRKVIMEHHEPLYGSGALFSHIGGLLAYWLGISVFSSLDIIEKFFWSVIICWTRFRKNKEQEMKT